jgi:phage terminase small subunit
MTIPKHLSSESKRTFRRIADEYDLTPDAGLILATALTQWDRASQAREAIALDGFIVGGKRNPALDVEKQAAGLFLRAMRQLGLDVAAPGPIGRPSTSV